MVNEMLEKKINTLNYSKFHTGFTINVADHTLGAKVLFASDEFFAPAERIISPSDPIFVPDLYDENGKWMDGWETRRKRSYGFDYCVIKLACPCVISKILVDTTHFTGNAPMGVTLDAIFMEDTRDEMQIDQDWIAILSFNHIEADHKNFFTIQNPRLATHIKLNIFPDGGVARLRVFGDVVFDEKKINDNVSNILCLDNGSKVIACSDNHYGSPINLLKSTTPINMGDGWETRRRRTPGNDWCIFKLPFRGYIHHIEIDTTHFKGNYPAQFSVQALADSNKDQYDLSDNLLVYQSTFWAYIVNVSDLQANTSKSFDVFDSETSQLYIKLNIYPDGGIARFKVWGKFGV